MGAIHIGMGEAVRVAKAKVDMRLSSKMEDGVDLMALHAVDDFGRIGDISLIEGKIPLIVEHASVVQRRAVVQLIEGHDVVRLRIRQGEMADNPASALDQCQQHPHRVRKDVGHMYLT